MILIIPKYICQCNSAKDAIGVLNKYHPHTEEILVNITNITVHVCSSDNIPSPAFAIYTVYPTVMLVIYKY